MAKAILELPEMPESCWQCPCIQDRTETYRWCGAVGGDCPNPPYERRKDDCPLKLVEGKENGCEYCIGENPPTLFENGETIIYYHPGHGRFLDGTYELNWKVCPMCGRRLEVEL